MVNQISEFLKEVQQTTNSELPVSLIEVLKTAPKQDSAPRELVEWLKQVRIEKMLSQYDDWFALDNLTKCIAIRKYYSPIQCQKANERASLELSNLDNGRQIKRKLQHLIK